MTDEKEETQETETTSTRAIPFAPVPMSWRISQGRNGEQLLVIVNIQTPEGDKVFFLESTMGKQLGDAIIKMSEASEQGVIFSE